MIATQRDQTWTARGEPAPPHSSALRVPKDSPQRDVLVASRSPLLVTLRLVQPKLSDTARPDLRLLPGPAEPAEKGRGQRFHPSSMPALRGPALYISGDRESRIRFTR